MITDYQVLVACTAEELRIDVLDAITDGWSLQGGVFVTWAEWTKCFGPHQEDVWVYAQAIVRLESDPPQESVLGLN